MMLGTNNIKYRNKYSAVSGNHKTDRSSRGPVSVPTELPQLHVNILSQRHVTSVRCNLNTGRARGVAVRLAVCSSGIAEQVALRGDVSGSRCFESSSCLHLQVASGHKMDELCSFETSANTRHTTQRFVTDQVVPR